MKSNVAANMRRIKDFAYQVHGGGGKFWVTVYDVLRSESRNAGTPNLLMYRSVLKDQRWIISLDSPSQQEPPEPRKSGLTVWQTPELDALTVAIICNHARAKISKLKAGFGQSAIGDDSEYFYLEDELKDPE